MPGPIVPAGENVVEIIPRDAAGDVVPGLLPTDFTLRVLSTTSGVVIGTASRPTIDKDHIARVTYNVPFVLARCVRLEVDVLSVPLPVTFTPVGVEPPPAPYACGHECVREMRVGRLGQVCVMCVCVCSCECGYMCAQISAVRRCVMHVTASAALYPKCLLHPN